MKNAILVGHSSFPEVVPIEPSSINVEVDQIADLHDLSGSSKRRVSNTDSSCSLYTVVRDPENNSVLFVLPYIRYKENAPL